MRIKKENIDNSQIKEEVTPAEEIKPDTDVNTDVDITPVEEVVVEDNSPIAIPGTDITENKLAELKGTFGSKSIFKTRFIDEIYIWHKLKRSVFAKIVSDTKDIQDDEEKIEKREQEFVKASLIYPDPGNQDIYEDDVLITGLAEEILYRSGFAQPETERL